jgi:hypothetical protein
MIPCINDSQLPNQGAFNKLLHAFHSHVYLWTPYLYDLHNGNEVFPVEQNF